MSILLPKFLSALNPAETIATCVRLRDAEDDVVEIDARLLAFVDPFALTLLGAVLYDLTSDGQKARVRDLRPNIGGYLQPMDLFREVEWVGSVLADGHRNDRRNSLLELTGIEGPGEAPETARRMAQALVGTVGADPLSEDDPGMIAESRSDRQLGPIKYVFSELLENAMTHGERAGFRGRCRVWAAAQYYPSNDKVRLAVADTECGVLETLRSHPELGAPTHLSAILTSMKPRVSCNRDLGVHHATVNQGVGLTTATRIAERARGQTLIVTGDAYHNTAGVSGNLRRDAPWQGVAVVIEMQRSELLNVRIREMLAETLEIPRIRPRFQ